MNTTLLKNLILSAAVSMLVTSCGTSAGASTGNAPSGGIAKTAGDAAVDAATKHTDPLTGAAIRNATGYGTDPIEKAKTDILNKIGL